MEKIKIDTSKATILIVVKPGADYDKAVKYYTDEGWEIYKTSQKTFTYDEAYEFWEDLHKYDFGEYTYKYMSSGPSTAVVFTKDEPASEENFKDARRIVGQVRYDMMDIRGDFYKTIVHASDTFEDMVRELPFYFDVESE